MLSLSKKTDYALVALVHLMHEPGDIVPARHIAEQYGLPTALLMNVMKELHREGVVSGQRGARGGYRLAIDPDDFTLFDLVTAMDGPVQVTECSCRDDEACRLARSCPVRGPLQGLHDAVVVFLKSLTLAQIARESAPQTEPAV